MRRKGQPTLSFRRNWTENTAFQAEQRGRIRASVLLPNDRRVAVCFYDPARLSQELKAAQEFGGICIADPGLIVVPKVTLENMTQAINQLYDAGYFESLTDITPVPCPCCGYLTLYAYLTYETNLDAKLDTCPVCCWVNDPAQSLGYDYESGSNTLSLMKAQENFRQFGVFDERYLGMGRPPRLDEIPE